MTEFFVNSCKMHGIVSFLRSSFSVCLALVLAGVFCGCSPREKKTPVPRTKGQLLLEIYDAVEKNQYATALQKIERYSVLDPSSAIIGEMKQTVRFNRLTAVVRFYLRQNNFRGALNAVDRFEKDYGISKRTMEAKEHLLFFARLDQAMEEACSARDSRALERALDQLEKIGKERKLSKKTVNFLRKEKSKLKQLRLYERDLTGEILCQESLLQAKENRNLRTAEVLFALVKAVYPGNAGLPEVESYFRSEGIYPD